MKKILIFFLLLCIPLVAFAEKSPMHGLKFNKWQKLNGRLFSPWQYAKSYREQDGYAIVQGIKLHYWLYDTYTYHNGSSDVIHKRIIPNMVKKYGVWH